MDRRREYWRANIRTVTILLAIWAAASLGCSILLVDVLNQVRIGSFKLGFWFAQQGSIYIFVILIFVYARIMNRLDKEYGLQEREPEPQQQPQQQAGEHDE